VVNAACARCPRGYFAPATNTEVCVPWKECPEQFEESEAPTLTSDRSCHPVTFVAEEIASSFVSTIAGRLVVVDLTARVRGVKGVQPFLVSVADAPPGSYVVGASVFLLYHEVGTFNFTAIVNDSVHRSFQRPITVRVKAKLGLNPKNSTELSIIECYRDRPCAAPLIVVTGGFPPLRILLQSRLPKGLKFINGMFNGTVTEIESVLPLSFIVSDSLGFSTQSTIFMQVSAHPISDTSTMLTSSSSTNGLLPTIGRAAAGGLLLVIIVAALIVRSRRDTSVNGMMMVKNPMFLPQSTMENFASIDDDDNDENLDVLGDEPSAAYQKSNGPEMMPKDYVLVESNVDDYESTMHGFAGSTIPTGGSSTGRSRELHAGTTATNTYAFATDNDGHVMLAADEGHYAFASKADGSGVSDLEADENHYSLALNTLGSSGGNGAENLADTGIYAFASSASNGGKENKRFVGKLQKSNIAGFAFSNVQKIAPDIAGPATLLSSNEMKPGATGALSFAKHELHDE
jgi:hypothetical protein